MRKYIDNVKNNLTAFSEALGNVDVGYSLVEYGDKHKDNVDVKTNPFVSTGEEFLKQIEGVGLTGGGNLCQSVLAQARTSTQGVFSLLS